MESRCGIPGEVVLDNLGRGIVKKRKAKGQEKIVGGGGGRVARGGVCSAS